MASCSNSSNSCSSRLSKWWWRLDQCKLVEAAKIIIWSISSSSSVSLLQACLLGRSTTQWVLAARQTIIIVGRLRLRLPLQKLMVLVGILLVMLLSMVRICNGWMMTSTMTTIGCGYFVHEVPVSDGRCSSLNRTNSPDSEVELATWILYAQATMSSWPP